MTNLESIRLLADLGLVLLLFALGLEFGWQRIRQMGLRVVLIGTIEFIFMMALGYEIGTLLGWTGTEAIFLGAALSISSSAVIVKVLRDTGTLFTQHGRLIVGILVVEDFVAVLLLSVLSGVATTGTANITEIGSLIGKLTLFLISSLALGALFAPRLMNLIAKLKSTETMLIVGLGLCFSLALIGKELGISAAAGAFIMGTVLGDTDHAEDLAHTMSPLRDVFAALFFVSIGMLINIREIAEFIVPALIISAVFLVGKVVVDTVSTFVVGHDGKTSLSVGMGMPQIGEFSLAIVKVGVDHTATGAFLYPVIAVATALTSLVYPFLFRSASATSDFLERRSPRFLREYFATLSRFFISMRTVFNLQGELADQVRHSMQVIVINFTIVVVLITVATFVLTFTSELAALVNIGESVVGLAISAVVVVLSVPPAVLIWRSLQSMTDNLSRAILRRRTAPSGIWERGNLHHLLRDAILVVMVILIAIWSLPFISQLLFLGRFATPIPILILIGLIVIAWRASFKIHKTLESAFHRTFVGDMDKESKPEHED